MQASNVYPHDTGESDPPVLDTQKEGRASEDLLTLMEGDTLLRDNINVAYDSTEELHPVNKNSPTLTPGLIKRAEQVLQAAHAAKAKGPQGGQVEGETNNDIGMDLD